MHSLSERYRECGREIEGDEEEGREGEREGGRVGGRREEMAHISPRLRKGKQLQALVHIVYLDIETGGGVAEEELNGARTVTRRPWR